MQIIYAREWPLRKQLALREQRVLIVREQLVPTRILLLELVLAILSTSSTRTETSLPEETTISMVKTDV